MISRCLHWLLAVHFVAKILRLLPVLCYSLKSYLYCLNLLEVNCVGSYLFDILVGHSTHVLVRHITHYDNHHDGLQIKHRENVDTPPIIIDYKSKSFGNKLCKCLPGLTVHSS